MYQTSFGSKNQVQFNNEHEYYKLLGFLAKSDGTTSLVWEHNEEQGAWGSEGRIQFHTKIRPFSENLSYTAGNGGNVTSRVNCNDFVQNINETHSFLYGVNQPVNEIRATIPEEFLSDFELGLAM